MRVLWEFVLKGNKLMFTPKPEAIIYLSRNGFQIFLTEEDRVLQQPFTPKTIVNLEVADSQALSEQINYFLETNNIKPEKALIILSEDMLFTKKIAARTPEARNDLVKEFLNNIPLDPQLIVHKVFTFRGYRLAVATNKDIFMSVKSIFETLKWKILYVVPDVIFIRGNIAPKKIMDLLHDKELLQMGNLLNLKTPKPVAIKEKKTLPIFLIAGPILALGIVVFIFLVLSNTIDLSGNKKSLDVTSINEIDLVDSSTDSVGSQQAGSEQEKVVEEESAEEDQIEDSETIDVDLTLFNIQVLNGAGIPGLAGSTQDDLEEIGFESIKVGNADAQDYEETEIAYKEGVPEGVINTIARKLEETFETVVPKTTQGELDYDIVITTGSLK